MVSLPQVDGAVGKKWTHPSHLEQAKVWSGFVADPRVENLTDRSEHGLIQAIHARRAQRESLRVGREVEVTDVCVIRTITSVTF